MYICNNLWQELTLWELAPRLREIIVRSQILNRKNYRSCCVYTEIKNETVFCKDAQISIVHKTQRALWGVKSYMVHRNGNIFFSSQIILYLHQTIRWPTTYCFYIFFKSLGIVSLKLTNGVDIFRKTIFFIVLNISIPFNPRIH